jgi:hypothetical protein
VTPDAALEPSNSETKQISIDAVAEWTTKVVKRLDVDARTERGSAARFPFIMPFIIRDVVNWQDLPRVSKAASVSRSFHEIYPPSVQKSKVFAGIAIPQCRSVPRRAMPRDSRCGLPLASTSSSYCRVLLDHRNSLTREFERSGSLNLGLTFTLGGRSVLLPRGCG